jgi:hypothetical protein
MPHHCWHLGTHKVRLIISEIQFIPGIPGIISFLVYRKARGPLRFRQHQVSSRRIHRWTEKTQVSDPWQRRMVEMEHKLKEALEHHYGTKKTAADLSRLHNYEPYQAMAKKGHPVETSEK